MAMRAGVEYVISFYVFLICRARAIIMNLCPFLYTYFINNGGIKKFNNI